MIGTITLNPSIDQHVLVRRLVKDDANRALSVVRHPGGKGLNVSKVVRELGGRTHAFALAGGFSGRLWEKLSRGLKIPFTSVPVAGDTRINTIITDVHDGTQTRISEPGPRMGPEDMRRFMKRLSASGIRPFVWVLGGSLSAGLASGTYREAITRLQRDGTPCVLDTDNLALKEGIRAKPFMIKPNTFEFERLFGRRFRSIKGYLSAARQLNGRGVRIVVVSLAERGALFVTAGEAFHVTVPRVAVHSRVGAGDSLIGGFVLALSRGLSLRRSAMYGAAASVSAVLREAPRLCQRGDMAGILRKIRLNELA